MALSATGRIVGSGDVRARGAGERPNRRASRSPGAETASVDQDVAAFGERGAEHGQRARTNIRGVFRIEDAGTKPECPGSAM